MRLHRCVCIVNRIYTDMILTLSAWRQRPPEHRMVWNRGLGEYQVTIAIGIMSGKSSFPTEHGFFSGVAPAVVMNHPGFGDDPMAGYKVGNGIARILRYPRGFI